MLGGPVQHGQLGTAGGRVPTAHPPAYALETGRRRAGVDLPVLDHRQRPLRVRTDWAAAATTGQSGTHTTMTLWFGLFARAVSDCSLRSLWRSNPTTSYPTACTAGSTASVPRWPARAGPVRAARATRPRRGAGAYHHLDLPGDQMAVALTQPDPGRTGHPERGVSSGPVAQADQGRVLLPQPGPQPLGLVLADRRVRLDQHDSDHVQQPGGDAEPVLTRPRDDHGPVQVQPVRRCGLQPEVGHPDHRRPLSRGGRTGQQGHGQAQAVGRVRSPGPQRQSLQPAPATTPGSG